MWTYLVIWSLVSVIAAPIVGRFLRGDRTIPGLSAATTRTVPAQRAAAPIPLSIPAQRTSSGAPRPMPDRFGPGYARRDRFGH